MGYTKQNFVSKQRLSAVELNYIEDGIVALEKAINNNVLTDADKVEIVEMAIETIVDDYIIRETVYLSLDGYCYSNDGIAYSLTNLGIESQADLKKYNFILIYESTGGVYHVPLKAYIVEGTIGFSGMFYYDELDAEGYRLISGRLVDMDDYVEFSDVRIAGEYINDYYGQLSVDKEALLGNIGNQTMKEYVDNIIPQHGDSVQSSIINLENGSGIGSLQQTNTIIPNKESAAAATGTAAAAFGVDTKAQGDYSFAEGRSTTAAVLCAHAEGARTTASGAAAHAEGADTLASGNRAHAEGSYTTASGSYSHAEGFHTKAESGYMHVQGKYNKTTSGYAHVVGWGEDEDNRRDIHRLSTEGGAWFAGKLYSGNNEITTNLSNGYKVIDGSRTEIPGALRQCNLILSLDSVKEYIIGKAYVKDECCWYNAGTEDVPVLELYRCTTSYGEAKTDTFIDLKDTYWELIDTSVEGFNFNNLKIPAQGYNPKAEGIGSFAVGYNTKAYKSYSFASGNGSVANKSGAHAEGYQTYADANASHTEGTFTKTHGDNSHAEGTNTVTTGHDAHAEGTDTGAAGLSSHTEGYQTIAGQFIEVITENLTIVNEDSIPASTFAKGTCVKYVLADGSGYRVYYCPANDIIFSEDSWVRAWFVRDSIRDDITYQLYALAVSDNSQFGEHAEGYQTIAQGQSAHAEGTSTKALADFAHAEGQLTSATGVNAHVEGRSSSATKDAAHAEGVSTTAGALAAHAEGQSTVAEGQASHVEGARSKTTAAAAAAHAEGADTLASGIRSHAEGEHTVASEAYQHVQGRYNIVDSNNKAGNYAHIVGNGTSAKRSNAHTLDWEGNAWFAGDVTAAGKVYSGDKVLATEEYVNSLTGNSSTIKDTWDIYCSSDNPDHIDVFYNNDMSSIDNFASEVLLTNNLNKCNIFCTYTYVPEKGGPNEVIKCRLSSCDVYEAISLDNLDIVNSYEFLCALSLTKCLIVAVNLNIHDNSVHSCSADMKKAAVDEFCDTWKIYNDSSIKLNSELLIPLEDMPNSSLAKLCAAIKNNIRDRFVYVYMRDGKSFDVELTQISTEAIYSNEFGDPVLSGYKYRLSGCFENKLCTIILSANNIEIDNISPIIFDVVVTEDYTNEQIDSAITAASSAAAEAVKNDLLNGAGEAYDTLKELGDLIDENQDAIKVLEDIATGKADKEHSHDDLYYKKETGKGLSSNDYTTADKNKLAELTTYITELETTIADLTTRLTTIETALSSINGSIYVVNNEEESNINE